MRNVFNKISALIIASMIFSIISGNLAFADTPDDGKTLSNEVSKYGYIEPDLNLEWAHDDSGLQKYNNLPSKYDMRDQSYGSRIAVRNQDDTGLCWAFATMTAAEINYYHTYGADAPEMMFSPLHLGYFTYNRVSDPMNLTKYDKNILVKDNYKLAGGNCAIAMHALSGWTGFALESKMPFENRYNNSFSRTLAYDNEMTLKGSYLIDPDNIDAIKSAVMEYGAVTTGIYMHDDYKFDNYTDENGVYNSESFSSNHMAVVVGWDDSKRAWLFQNSWSRDWGDDGYFYVSYDEPSMDLIAAVEVQPADTYAFNYFYDGTVGVEVTTAERGQQFANMYTGFRDNDENSCHSLEAVGLTIFDTNYCEYTIDIYTNCDLGEPTSGIKALSFVAATENAGFHTFELPKSVKIEDNLRYSIVITFHQDTDVAMEATSYIGNDVTFSARTARGQSFSSDSRGNFTDLNNEKVSIRIKGFANTVDYRTVDINRYAGKTRYITAEEISNALKDYQNVSKFKTVIIASGENYPDALSGSYLSKVNGNAPILLTTSTLEKDTIQYVDRNLEASGTVYILGGIGVVSSELEKTLKHKGYEVIRLAGANRYETNLEILEEAGIAGTDILICSGNGYADSLSASAVGKPIMLVGDILTNEQYEYLYDNYYYGEAFIIGGIGAVSKTIEYEIMTWVDEVHRLEGINRYETSALVAKEFFGNNITYAVFAYGQNFPDGLSGGPLALELGVPLLLVDNFINNAYYTKGYMGGIAELYEVTVLGGETLISDHMIQYITR